MTDKERIDWLEEQVERGACPAVVNDDNGHWAVAFDGVQSVCFGEEPTDVETAFWIKAEQWKDSIREAIDASITEHANDVKGNVNADEEEEEDS